MARLRMDIGLFVTIHREGEYFVAHAPALDLSTAGRSVAEAKHRFSEAAELFFEELGQDPERLEYALLDLGWVKKDHRWSPPVPVAHESMNVRIPA